LFKKEFLKVEIDKTTQDNASIVENVITKHT